MFVIFHISLRQWLLTVVAAGLVFFADGFLVRENCVAAESKEQKNHSQTKSTSLEPTATWTPKSAHWIWLPGEEKPKNSYVQFRKTFDLESVPDKATVHASADCRYLLWINGAVVGRGPLTTNPKYKQVDVYDVASLMKRGKNTITALVLQRQNKTSRLWPVRGGFLLELDAGKIILGTDVTWKARWAVEYKSDTPKMTEQYGQQEWFDARRAAVGWREPDYDDGKWEDAVVVSNPEKFWATALELRPMPHMLRELIHPTRLVSHFGIAPSDKEADGPARQIMDDQSTDSIIVKDPDNVSCPKNGPVVFRNEVGDGIGFVVDLGEEMLGYPFIELESPAGIVVDIGHSELLYGDRTDTNFSRGKKWEQRYADKYITKAGRQRFEIFDSKGCRYLEVHLRHIPKGTSVILHEIGLMRSRAPIECKSEFSCSDELLNRIAEICSRTADVKCQDWHIADAHREQNQWMEIYQDFLYVHMYGRCQLLRETIHNFARAQMSSGMLPSTIPSIYAQNPNPGPPLYIFATFQFPVVVYLDWLYGGEDPRQLAWLESCNRVFDGLFKYLGPDGVLRNTPGRQWVEWSNIDTRPNWRLPSPKKSWEVAYYNIWLVLSLEKTADMARSLGRDDLAAKWSDRAAKLRLAVDRRYWSGQRQAYLDGVYDEVPSKSVSQATNAIAVLTRIGNRARLLSALDTVADTKLCDVPVAINTMLIYHQAMESMDRDSTVLNTIRTKWKKMLDLGATTTWESFPEGSNVVFGTNKYLGGTCFGFGAHPFNYMVRNFLGVVPLEPGYRRFSVRIAPFDLKHARGKVATPYGYIKVSWELCDERINMKLTVPEGTEAIVAAPRMGKNKSVTKIDVDGRTVQLQPQPVATSTFSREQLPACRLGSGQHELSMTILHNSIGD